MIRGIDFYNYCFNEINKYNNIEIVYGNVKEVCHHRRRVQHIEDRRTKFFHLRIHIRLYSIRYIILDKRKNIRLLQHFKGWVIETTTLPSIPVKATLMDFRTSPALGN